MNNAFNLILKYLFPFTSWFLGVYIALFVMCFYAHVNESNIIANRVDALITEITHNKPSLVKVSSVQSMVRKTKPSFLEPSTIVYSLLGKREPFKIINKILGNTIESRKDGLAGLSLGQVDLEGADLSNADMHGATLIKANLSEANLSGANFVAAKLNFANFQGASFLNAKVYRADFKEALLSSADLRHVVGLTCAQIKSAVIDESTYLPDYISIVGSTKSVFKCVSLLKGGGMDLRGINLENVYLFSADLTKSNLSHVNFQNATLARSDIYDADLSEANLQGTNLTHSQFNETNFTGADLRGADLRGAGLRKADLRKADLRGANLNRAIGVTCEQIKSAVIDESTYLPDYISLTGSLGSAYKCENTLNEN